MSHVGELHIGSATEFSSTPIPWERLDYNAMLTHLAKDQHVYQAHSSNPTFHYKTKMCNSVLTNGLCVYVGKCNFAHSLDELRVPVHIPVSVLRRIVNSKYKTKLCNKFHVFGSCPYGDRCLFIHQRSSPEDSLFSAFNLGADFSNLSLSPSSTPERSVTSPDMLRIPRAIGEERQAQIKAFDDVSKRWFGLLP